jgi:hypothetical protein
MPGSLRSQGPRRHRQDADISGLACRLILQSFGNLQVARHTKRQSTFVVLYPAGGEVGTVYSVMPLAGTRRSSSRRSCGRSRGNIGIRRGAGVESHHANSLSQNGHLRSQRRRPGNLRNQFFLWVFVSMVQAHMMPNVSVSSQTAKTPLYDTERVSLGASLKIRRDTVFTSSRVMRCMHFRRSR